MAHASHHERGRPDPARHQHARHPDARDEQDRPTVKHDRPRDPRWTGERGREPLPLEGYALLLGIYGLSLGSFLAWATRNDRLPDHIPLTDLAILGLGSHKLARMASRDRISTVLRQPFTIYEGTEGALPGEANERPRPGKVRQAVGELLTCPYCTAAWASAAVFGAYVAHRNLGRTIGAYLGTVSIADMMHSVYTKVLRL